MAWTISQTKAIEDRDHTLLVSAGAGAGKTSCLTERIARRLTEKGKYDENGNELGYDINDILVVTFTKAAANDIKEKLYNDEAVATENYFEIEEQLSSTLDQLKEADFKIEESFLEEIERDNKYSNSNRYYDTVCSELEQIFNKFPEEQQLKKTFSKSRWAKVYYSDTKYYVVGVIKESGKEKYICYGVPATYSKTPPKELDGYCTFIPLSIFSLLGDGYWMMFQDAVTGECIKPK